MASGDEQRSSENGAAKDNKRHGGLHGLGRTVETEPKLGQGRGDRQSECDEPFVTATDAAASVSGSMTRGNVSVKTAPSPSMLSTVMSPPIARARSRLIDSPSPVPW